MKCEAIYMHSSEFSVRKMCKELELCESSYYQWLRGEKRRQARTREKKELILKVKEVFEEHNCMESFFASMKKEYFSGKEYATIEAVEKHLFYYIEIFYNRKRLHSALGYMSPVAFRLKNERKCIA